MKICIPLSILISLGLAGTVEQTPSQPANPSNEPLADQVLKSINLGIKYLKGRQQPDGSWEDSVVSVQYKGGETALVMLALLNAGVSADDPGFRRGLDFLRKLDKPTNYARALQTMVLVEAGKSQDLELIQSNVKHFQKNAIRRNGKLAGWGYDRGNGSLGEPDNSNTQYALLAVWVARKSGVDAQFWKEVNDLYVEMQGESGAWAYPVKGDERLTMTTAGLCGLFMAEMELSAGRKNPDPVADCGKYEDNKAIRKGLDWISSSRMDHFAIAVPHSAFYNLYGIERLGRLSGMRFLGQHDWYREGCAWLVKKQNKETGAWSINEGIDVFPTISTSFAVLFLSKGRTPVLISKLAYGPPDDKALFGVQDWNRRHNDLRNLVDYVSDNVFKKTPLAWQIFDVRRQRGVTPQGVQELTSELLQSPILYMTGHESPMQNRLTGVEEDLIKAYVDNGGFILAVACCGSKKFSGGFDQLCQKLWPNSELTDLELDHPVWNMRFNVNPNAFRLKGIQQGCKTVAILCEDNLCGYWEIDRRVGPGQAAFQLGANIIAYATGLEPPKPRLTPITVTGPVRDNPLDSPPRDVFRIGQLIGQVGEEAAWKPAPQAMGKLAQNCREILGLDVVIKTANVPIDSKDLTKYKFLYMHGRKDFKFTGQQLERLRFNLKNGGLLLADACCGKEAFDKGFRQFILDLFPADAFPSGEAPRLVPIKPDDVLFSKELNGEALTDANILCRIASGKSFQRVLPILEGVKIGDRWAVIYSKYDLGCALEKHQSADCVGYSYDSAMRIGRAAIQYHFWP